LALSVMGGLYPPDAINMSLVISIVCIWYRSITTLPQNECDIILHFLIPNLSNSFCNPCAYSGTHRAVLGTWDLPNHGKSGIRIL
jgi:hypothetical protein